jgi:hypothetical protein
MLTVQHYNDVTMFGGRRERIITQRGVYRVHKKHIFFIRMVEQKISNTVNDNYNN